MNRRGFLFGLVASLALIATTPAFTRDAQKFVPSAKLRCLEQSIDDAKQLEVYCGVHDEIIVEIPKYYRFNPRDLNIQQTPSKAFNFSIQQMPKVFFWVGVDYSNFQVTIAQQVLQMRAENIAKAVTAYNEQLRIELNEQCPGEHHPKP